MWRIRDTFHLHNAGCGVWLPDGNRCAWPSPPLFGVTIVRKALVGLLLFSGLCGATGCHELTKMERWKNEKLFGRSTCLPHHGGSPDECCEYEDGGPGFVDEGPIYVE